jgi:hypothetical protein
MRFENETLKKIYESNKLIDGNEELDNLREHRNVIHFIKFYTIC